MWFLALIGIASPAVSTLVGHIWSSTGEQATILVKMSVLESRALDHDNRFTAVQQQLNLIIERLNRSHDSYIPPVERGGRL
jgi:hypothetical protein